MSRTPAELTNLEAALAGLAPSAGGLNRDRLMYAAGRQAAPRRLAWPRAATAFAALSIALGLCLALRPEPPPRTLIVYLTTPVAAPPREAEAPPLAMTDDANWGQAFRTTSGYLSQRDQMLFFGVEALPTAPAAAEMPPEPRQDLKSLHKLI